MIGTEWEHPLEMLENRQMVKGTRKIHGDISIEVRLFNELNICNFFFFWKFTCIYNVLYFWFMVNWISHKFQLFGKMNILINFQLLSNSFVLYVPNKIATMLISMRFYCQIGTDFSKYLLFSNAEIYVTKWWSWSVCIFGLRISPLFCYSNN